MEGSIGGKGDRSDHHGNKGQGLGNSLQQKLQTCQTDVGSYAHAWKEMDGAGTHLLDSFRKILNGSQYAHIAKEFANIFGSVYAATDLEPFSGRLKEMENLLLGLQTQMNLKHGDGISHVHEQIVCRCLLLFLKLQVDYHQLCSQSLSSLVNRTLQLCDAREHGDFLQQMKNLEIISVPSSRQSPTHVLKKSVAQGGGSPKTQKHGMFKSSLFSLFERKNSPEEGKSSFYVDLNQPSAINQSQAENRSHETGSNKSDVLIQLGLDPSQSSCDAPVATTVSMTTESSQKSKEGLTSGQGPVSGSMARVPGQNVSPGSHGQAVTGSPSIPAKGQLATQEELDSVINLLSGVGTGLSPMQTIPEHQDQSSLKVPSLYGSLSPSPSDTCIDDVKNQRNQNQRRSEGSIDLSGFGIPGHNTWPYQHRSSLPSGHLNTQTLYDYGNPSYQGLSPQEMTSRPAMTLPAGGTGQFGAGYQWAFPDNKLNRTWPMNNLTGSASDIINSSWSGAVDSDDLSDDSSTGDQFFTTGHDLIHSMEARRAVGSDDTNHSETGRHRSLEDLLDSQTGTWTPASQPWSQSTVSREPADSHEPAQSAGYHRPVQMQWSDPLSSRNMWSSPGIGTQQQQLQSQSVHGFGQL